MNRREIGSLAIKIAGIYAIVKSFPMMQQFGAFIGNYKQIQESIFEKQDYSILGITIGIATPIFLLIAFGAYLILSSNTLASRMYPIEGETEEGISSHGIQKVAFSIIGLIFVIHATPQLVTNLVYIFTSPAMDSPIVHDRMLRDRIINSTGYGTQIVLGVALFVGGGKLSSLWYKLKNTRPLKET
jgi:hypothetical protein